MDFSGFSPRAGEFMWELSFHNERPWFLEHREDFEALVNRPLRALCAATLDRMQQRCPALGFEAHVSRIYRDARRLFGRGPYKENLWFSLYAGPKQAEQPVFWFEFGRSGCSAGLGFWEASPARMEAFRRRIDANPAAFEGVLEGLDPAWKLWGEEYKRPKAERGPRLNPWYNRKSVAVGREWDLGGEETDPALPDRLADMYTRLLPLYEFLTVL